MKEKKYLLVEDDQDHADLITNVLREDDVNKVKTEVILKKDGNEAINYFQHEMQPQVSVIILDLNLPKIDGMDVLKFIRKDSKYCSIPVIVLSTNSDRETIAEAHKNGANFYFIKTASHEDFIENIRLLKNVC